MNTIIDQQSTTPVRGYLEGYYGKLLSWSERNELLAFLATQKMNTYCYAPKEDISHRLRWRDEYTPQWHESFAGFCESAIGQNVSVVAGIAPGLDFHFDEKSSDFSRLQSKATQFLDDGANEILILWDDIDESCYINTNGVSEGAAHAHVINQLSDSIGQPVWTVPRIYAAEIDNKNRYLEAFFTELHPRNSVMLCGNTIVAQNISQEDLNYLCRTNASSEHSSFDGAVKHRTIVWDNFYANDYCPRQLFLGPWTGRENISEYLLNPTGLPHTDRLLLDIANSTHTSIDKHKDWQLALQRHGVPDAFLTIAPYFHSPFFSNNHGDVNELDNAQGAEPIEPNGEQEQAIEECLWKWKSPLAREWYPFLFGLKHDLALARGTLPKERVLKTQPSLLAKRLLS